MASWSKLGETSRGVDDFAILRRVGGDGISIGSEGIKRSVTHELSTMEYSQNMVPAGSRSEIRLSLSRRRRLPLVSDIISVCNSSLAICVTRMTHQIAGAKQARRWHLLATNSRLHPRQAFFCDQSPSPLALVCDSPVPNVDLDALKALYVNE
jgi:hypothetical protein